MAHAAGASEAPPDIQDFNVECPAKDLCPKINESYQACLKQNESDCGEFVDVFKKLLPEYDCQRPWDATESIKYIVPAVWLCGDDNLPKYVAQLSSLKIRKARVLFASPEFRNMLDGILAEEYTDQSLAVEKEMKKH
jgi:hypothetical protein